MASALPSPTCFTDHRIRDRADFNHHRDYIHYNPVRARLCQRPEDFPWSSAHKTLAPEALQLPQRMGTAKAVFLYTKMTNSDANRTETGRGLNLT